MENSEKTDASIEISNTKRSVDILEVYSFAFLFFILIIHIGKGKREFGRGHCSSGQDSEYKSPPKVSN